MVYGLDPDANPGYGISAEGNAAIDERSRGVLRHRRRYSLLVSQKGIQTDVGPLDPHQYLKASNGHLTIAM